MLVGLVGAVVVAAPSSATAAPGGSSCSFANAGSGTYARTLCWFDMSPYNPSTAGSGAGQSMSVALPGGYSISFTLKVSGGPVKATGFPTYSGAYLGNGAYTGVAGKPALYQTQSGTTTTATLSGISVVDSQGNPVTGYSFVGADAESTDTGESITWTSDEPLSLISNIRQRLQLGGLVDRRGHYDGEMLGYRHVDQDRHRHPGRRSPVHVFPDLRRPGIAGGGVRCAGLDCELNKTVASRINPSDAFAVQVSSSTGSVLGSANTGTATTASTGQLTVLTSSAGENYTLSESATSGPLSDYQPAWCAPATAPSTRPCLRGRPARRRL